MICGIKVRLIWTDVCCSRTGDRRGCDRIEIKSTRKSTRTLTSNQEESDFASIVSRSATTSPTRWTYFCVKMCILCGEIQRKLCLFCRCAPVLVKTCPLQRKTLTFVTHIFHIHTSIYISLSNTFPTGLPLQWQLFIRDLIIRKLIIRIIN